jgi:hypothetical protein
MLRLESLGIRGMMTKTRPPLQSGRVETIVRGGEVFSSSFGSDDGVLAACSKSIEAILGSSIPSARLEHDAQRFGFLERGLSGSAIFSPQQMQILGFIWGLSGKTCTTCFLVSQFQIHARTRLTSGERGVLRRVLSSPSYQSTEAEIRQGSAQVFEWHESTSVSGRMGGIKNRKPEIRGPKEARSLKSENQRSSVIRPLRLGS